MTIDQQIQREDPHVETRQAAIAVEGIRKSYDGRTVLDGVDLNIGAGEFFGILGPNGAGKTTLVETIEGLRRADDGQVRVLDSDPAGRDPKLLQRLGVQTQKGAFFTRLTAREHLRTMAALYHVAPDRADDALEMVGIAANADTRVERLSGGQRQRLAIAGALVHRPDVIFLDEPTAALDPQARRELWTVLRGLKGEGRTIVYTTHHLDEAEALCDRVAILVDGRIRALDSPHALKNAARKGSRVLVPAHQVTLQQAESLAGVESVHESGGMVVLETESASRVLLQLNDICGLDDVQAESASLEDVYLELTA